MSEPLPAPSSTTDLRPLVDLALRQHGVIHHRQLGEVGIRRSRYRRLVEQGFLRSVEPLVFAVGGAVPTWEQKLMIGLLQLGSDALVSSEAAAALHGFDTFARKPVCFLVPQNRRSVPSVGRVRSSARLEEEDACTVDEIRCTSPARTIFDLASVVSRRRLEHAIDSGLRDRLFSEDELVEVLTRLRERGRPGVARMEEAIAIAGGPQAHSVLERRFLRLVTGAGLPTPTSQAVFVDDDQRFVARVDFLFEGVVIVEVEGHRFHSTRAQRQRDNQRRNRLARDNKAFLAFTFEDVRDRGRYVVREIEAALRAAARHPAA